MMRRFDESISGLRVAIETDPTFVPLRNALALRHPVGL